MGRKTDDTKIKKKKAIRSLYICSTYFLNFCLEQNENTKKKDQGDSNGKGKTQTFVICRHYDST